MYVRTAGARSAPGARVRRLSAAVVSDISFMCFLCWRGVGRATPQPGPDALFVCAGASPPSPHPTWAGGHAVVVVLGALQPPLINPQSGEGAPWFCVARPAPQSGAGAQSGQVHPPSSSLGVGVAAPSCSFFFFRHFSLLHMDIA